LSIEKCKITKYKEKIYYYAGLGCIQR
jgi:hypothetical protein